jgi:hypothetical protein
MIFLERISTVLSIAIMLKDELSPDQRAMGDLFLQAPLGADAPRHSTGYFLLFNLPEEQCTVTAGGMLYQEQKFTVDPTALDTFRPLVDLFLKPNAAYPFPEGVTVLKSMVVDENYKFVSDASITVKSMTESAVSDDHGAFFILFNTITVDKSIGLTIQKEGFTITKVKVLVTAGTTTVYPEIILTRK